MLAVLLILGGIQGIFASCDARPLIALHEGKRKCVYKDTMGHPTIGIGYNLDNPGARQAIEAVGADYDSIRAGKTCLTDSQIMKLFEPSYQSAVSGARRAVSSYDNLCCKVQNVMTDMDYNLGDDGFASFHGFISLINKKSWAAAAADGEHTAWCGQVGLRCTGDMAAVRAGCGGPSPSPPGPSPPSPGNNCCKCVAHGGGRACVLRCTGETKKCKDCIEYGGGKACGARCGCDAHSLSNSSIVV
eukprot:gnl/TRDRNA2_/TRDRNA2_28889_c0_seq1.p1 gnl/TRDRNA2_/TRDRNA2_28889_c0~~gnl/TRDRNA2_/TRDRNA2_28889_c0_seq1.p1  ORF type:complete len:254 (-),score=46.45 gnl/TRDRNA2_/TRDRNA2_28889_c0_seq1:84-818(-)